MANWIGVVTNAGNALFAQWLVGTKLNISSSAAGSGTVPAAALLAQTALVNQKQVASIVSYERMEKGIKLKLQITAPQTGYSLNQFGIWGALDGGMSTMLAIFQNEDNIPIPSRADSPDFVYTFYGIVTVSNTGDFSVTIDASTVVSMSTMTTALNNAVKAHSTDSDTHRDIRQAVETAQTAANDAKSIANGINLGTISGTLPVSRGGTGKTNWMTSRLIYPSTSTALTQLSYPLKARSFLRQNTSGAPYWSAPSTTLKKDLITTEWIGSEPPFTYTLLVAGVTTSTNQDILPALEITEEELNALQAANIQDGGQSSGSITLKAWGYKPDRNIPIRVIIRGDV